MGIHGAPSTRITPQDGPILRLSDMSRLLESGKAAEKNSGLVPAHIEAYKAVARETDTILMFRPVNPDAAFLIAHEHLPVKGLSIKLKSAKGGVCGAHLLVPGESAAQDLAAELRASPSRRSYTPSSERSFPMANRMQNTGSSVQEPALDRKWFLRGASSETARSRSDSPTPSDSSTSDLTNSASPKRVWKGAFMKSPVRNLLRGLGKHNEGTESVYSMRTGASIVSLKMSDERFEFLIDQKRLDILEETADSIVVKELDTKDRGIYKLQRIQSDQLPAKFKVWQRDEKTQKWECCMVKAENGKPLTSDYDLQALLPRIKVHGFAGKDGHVQTALLHTRIQQMRNQLNWLQDTSSRGDESTKNREQLRAKKSESIKKVYVALNDVVSNFLLDQPERSQVDLWQGRRTRWQAHVIKLMNEATRATGYRGGDLVKHGTEQDNTQRPEKDKHIFIITPEGETLRTKNWKQFEAFMHAARLDGFLAYENRAYNSPAGSRAYYRNQQIVPETGTSPEGSGRIVKFEPVNAAKTMEMQLKWKSTFSSLIHGASALTSLSRPFSRQPSVASLERHSPSSEHRGPDTLSHRFSTSFQFRKTSTHSSPASPNESEGAESGSPTAQTRPGILRRASELTLRSLSSRLRRASVSSPKESSPVPLSQSGSSMSSNLNVSPQAKKG